LSFAPGETKTFTLVLTAGAGVAGGEYVNQATAYNSLTHGLISNLASATVRIVGDPTFDCPDLIGKVFDDVNANGVPDPGEKGIAGVRLVTAQGLLVTTDADGRYHIACPVISPDAMGSNFIVKVDERTLPSGYRLTTDNPETVRLTAGKVTKLNFGATIHRVVRIEVNDSAYEGIKLRSDVDARLDALVASLKDQAAIVRLAYESANEPDSLVAERMQVLKSAVTALWKAKECRYPLRIEEDIVRSARPPAGGGTNTP
jgi:large repetitive protein